MNRSHIFVTVLTDRNATVAEVEVGDVSATGSAKREPGETFDLEVGQRLALSRALRAASRELERKALDRLASLPSNATPDPEVPGPADIARGFEGLLAWFVEVNNFGRMARAQRDATRRARWEAKIRSCQCPPDAADHAVDCASWPGEPRFVGGRAPWADEQAANEELLTSGRRPFRIKTRLADVPSTAPPDPRCAVLVARSSAGVMSSIKLGRCGRPMPCSDHPPAGTVTTLEPGRCTVPVRASGDVQFYCGHTMPCLAHPSVQTAVPVGASGDVDPQLCNAVVPAGGGRVAWCGQPWPCSVHPLAQPIKLADVAADIPGWAPVSRS